MKKHGERQSIFRSYRKLSSTASCFLDMERYIIWVIYWGQFSKWKPLRILLLTFLNSFILPSQRSYINSWKWFIIFHRWSITMTSLLVLIIWSRDCHILNYKASTILTQQRIAPYCPLPLNGEGDTECIWHISRKINSSHFCALYYGRYIIQEKHLWA